MSFNDAQHCQGREEDFQICGANFFRESPSSRAVQEVTLPCSFLSKDPYAKEVMEALF